jgi:hypothetical protein
MGAKSTAAKREAAEKTMKERKKEGKRLGDGGGDGDGGDVLSATPSGWALQAKGSADDDDDLVEAARDGSGSEPSGQGGEEDTQRVLA